ncbi:SLC45 family MFS transporter [Paenibacillus tarimensis]|uniref:SLC45 family MFS transporter n=1 Tax=Paenibacillus tarimensis TaxID=416012 RepID=UPI001F338F78|nr:SLC45 family MFS transporter [Paenibacillus tarimensis]MCF2945047.1 SLC45 family MFS transporter [Paenibacillus tarimensis]
MKKTWLLGFGFFSISLTWALYNAFVPFFLEPYLKSTAMIGFMMTIDNYFAMFLQPWIGRRSDRTNTRFGRRMPYLLVGMPLAALFVTLVPFHTGFLTLILFLVLMNLSMSVYRSPVIALMPDITPEAKRTQANGIINFMGGIGAIMAFGGGSMLYQADRSLPFLAAAAVTLVSLFIVFRFIKERRGQAEEEGDVETADTVAGGLRGQSLRSELNRTTVMLLAAVFFWFVSYQGVEALFTLYGKNHLGMDESAASFSLTFFSLFFVLFAIPSGMMGSRFGKKNVIVAGVCGLFLVFAAVSFVKSLVMLRLLLALGGIFWACININSYPLVVATGRESSIGTRTGLYYLVSSLAAIVSPPLLGQVIDWFGYAALFYCASGGLLLALLMLLQIRQQDDRNATINLPSKTAQS